jgi:hypothetical protein
MNSQVSLTDQLKKLIPIANKNGLYDAADFLKSYVETIDKKVEARLTERETSIIRQLSRLLT